MDTKQTIAENLKYLIGEKSVSQIAKEIGMPQQTLHRYVRAERMISLPNLIQIANFFQESIDFLVGLRSH